MKYVMVWLLIAALVGLAAALGWVIWLIAVAISSTPNAWVLPMVLGAAALVATVATAIDYLQDHRGPVEPS